MHYPTKSLMLHGKLAGRKHWEVKQGLLLCSFHVPQKSHTQPDMLKHRWSHWLHTQDPTCWRHICSESCIPKIGNCCGTEWGCLEIKIRQVQDIFNSVLKSVKTLLCNSAAVLSLTSHTQDTAEFLNLCWSVWDSILLAVTLKPLLDYGELLNKYIEYIQCILNKYIEFKYMATDFTGVDRKEKGGRSHLGSPLTQFRTRKSYHSLIKYIFISW